MKILVTGGNGFVGGRLVDALLNAGYEVRSFARSSQTELEAKGVLVYQGDLANLKAVSDAVKGCDAVFHVAAKAGIWGDEASYYNANVVGTRNVITACRKHEVKRLIYTSTPSVVFNGKPFCGDGEELPYGGKWLCAYPKTKAMAEKEVLDANSKTLKTVALRPHLIWGDGDPHIVPRILEKASQGKLRVVGDGKNRVDISHVDNVVHAHLLALDKLDIGDCAGKAYFISDGKPVFLWDWIQELLEKTGTPKLSKKISLRKAYVIGGLLEFIYRVFKSNREPPMTRFVAVELAKDHFFCIERARKDLGYSPIISSEEAMLKLLNSLA